jgi:hypothetical protein
LLAERNLDLRINQDGTNWFVDLLSREAPLVSIESKRVGAQRFFGSDKLGAGIQTIEKAKQASLVALDIDLRNNLTIKPLAANKPRRCISCVVLGNGVHWDEKDRAVMGTYVDYVFLLADEAIIRYADYIKSLAEAAKRDFLQFLMSYFQGMTKMIPDEFEVGDTDLICLEPKARRPGLLSVLERHIRTQNAV